MSTNNSWNNQIAAAKSAITLNSGTNNVNISTDASATTVNIATGAAAKTVTLGSTNSTSSLALQYGTNDFTLASASGNAITASDAGEVLKPLQPCFYAYRSTTVTNVTGAGTTYTVIFDSERYDIGSDYNTATGIFTASVTGKYFLSTCILWNDITAAMTRSNDSFTTSNASPIWSTVNVGAMRSNINSFCESASIILDLDAGDTAKVDVLILNGAGDTADIQGNANSGITVFSGYLIG